MIRKFWLDVETVVITTLKLQESLQTRSSAFRITGLLCQIFLPCGFFFNLFHRSLSKSLVSEQAQQCESLKRLSGIDTFILNLNLFVEN